MANLGLLGAIGGFGQALQTAGKDIIARRERALENARQLAKEQRDRANKIEDREDLQAHGLEELGIREEGDNRRTAANIRARREEKAEDREFRAQEREEDRAFKREEKATDRAQQIELTRLKSQLDAANSAAAERLKKQLEGNEVRGIKYGAPDEKGLSPVFKILKDGTVVYSGQRIRLPARDDQEQGTTY